MTIVKSNTKFSTEYVTDKAVRDAKEKGGTASSRHLGIGNKNVRELLTHFASTEAESVIRGSTNAFIVLGKDRDAGETSGYGGLGHSGAACIDLVAGHGGSRPMGEIAGIKIPTGKDFVNDAARIYISQKSDPDSYFSIPKVQMTIGKETLDVEMSEMVSTVCAKADTVRLIGRENIKIVTMHKGLNSDNRETYDGGVDIIAGCNVAPYDTALTVQPMVKGYNLIELFNVLIDNINRFQSTTNKFIMEQIKFNSAVSTHVHQSGNAGSVTSEIVQNDTKISNFKLLTYLVPELIQNKVTIITDTEKYLRPLDEKYINSIWNRVN